MPITITKQEDFLIKEYESAVQLTYHIDELRNKMTIFYLTFTGVAGVGMTILLKGEAADTLSDKAYGVMGGLLLLISLIGMVVIQGMARMRRVQIEHFQIISNLRKIFLASDYDLWNAVQLSSKTVPTPNRRSGTYMWLLMVMFISSSLFAISIYLFLVKVFVISAPLSGGFVGLAAFILFMILQDHFYLAWAKPLPQNVYSDEKKPF
jgi:hypothetical protein